MEASGSPAFIVSQRAQANPHKIHLFEKYNKARHQERKEGWEDEQGRAASSQWTTD